MGTRKKIPVTLFDEKNIKLNLQILVDICGYESPTNLQNFTPKGLTEVKILQQVLWGGGYFLNTP